jgi:hypothetical protein
VFVGQMVFIVLNVSLLRFKIVDSKVILRDYSCIKCGNNFSDFTSTLFEYSEIPFGKILYILINMKTKSVSQLAKELYLYRNTVGRHHKRIREFLVENHVDHTFNGEIEMDEVYIVAGEKGIKKIR